MLFCMGDLDAVLASPIGSMSPTTQVRIFPTDEYCLLNISLTLFG
jgi:hypothetical protein